MWWLHSLYMVSQTYTQLQKARVQYVRVDLALQWYTASGSTTGNFVNFPCQNRQKRNEEKIRWWRGVDASCSCFLTSVFHSYLFSSDIIGLLNWLNMRPFYGSNFELWWHAPTQYLLPLNIGQGCYLLGLTNLRRFHKKQVCFESSGGVLTLCLLHLRLH